MAKIKPNGKTNRNKTKAGKQKSMEETLWDSANELEVVIISKL